MTFTVEQGQQTISAESVLNKIKESVENGSLGNFTVDTTKPICSVDVDTGKCLTSSPIVTTATSEFTLDSSMIDLSEIPTSFSSDYSSSVMMSVQPSESGYVSAAMESSDFDGISSSVESSMVDEISSLALTSLLGLTSPSDIASVSVQPSESDYVSVTVESSYLTDISSSSLEPVSEIGPLSSTGQSVSDDVSYISSSLQPEMSTVSPDIFATSVLEDSSDISPTYDSTAITAASISESTSFASSVAVQPHTVQVDSVLTLTEEFTEELENTSSPAFKTLETKFCSEVIKYSCFHYLNFVIDVNSIF